MSSLITRYDQHRLPQQFKLAQCWHFLGEETAGEAVALIYLQIHIIQLSPQMRSSKSFQVFSASHHARLLAGDKQALPAVIQR